MQPRQIPDRGCGEIQMRVVGEQRSPRRRPARRCGPGIGRARQTGRGERRQRLIQFGHPVRIAGHHAGHQFGILRQGCGQNTRHHFGILRQGGDSSPGIIRQYILQPRRRDCHRHLGPQHFAVQMGRQLQRHQLDDGNAVRGGPGVDLGREQKELRRAATQCAFVDLFDPRIHARRIGLQGGFGVIILGRDRRQGQRVKVQPPDQLIGFQGLGPEHLGQPALHRAAQQGHLPKPVLGMGEPQSVIGVIVVLRKDMRHIGIVAHNLDRGRDARHIPCRIIVRQRAGQKVIQHQQGQQPEANQRHKGTQSPAEGSQHGRDIFSVSLTGRAESPSSPTDDPAQLARQ